MLLISTEETAISKLVLRCEDGHYRGHSMDIGPPGTELASHFFPRGGPRLSIRQAIFSGSYRSRTGVSAEMESASVVLTLNFNMRHDQPSSLGPILLPKHSIENKN